MRTTKLHQFIDMAMPPMRCDKGCGKCCGPVAASGEEYGLIAHYAEKRGIKPLDQGSTCPWYQDGLCAVHVVRPAICRLFGHVKGMACPVGYDTPAPPAAVEFITLRMGDHATKHGVRFLHEALGLSQEAVMRIIAEESRLPTHDCGNGKDFLESLAWAKDTLATLKEPS